MSAEKYVGLRIRWAAFDELLRLPPRQCKRILAAVLDYNRDMKSPDFRGNRDDEIAFSNVEQSCDAWVIE